MGFQRFPKVSNSSFALIPLDETTLPRVIPTVTSYYYISVPNSDILCAKIWRGRGGEENSDEI